MTSQAEFRVRYIKKFATFIARNLRPNWDELTPRDAFLIGVRCAVNDREAFMQSPQLSELYSQWLEEISGGSPAVPEPPTTLVTDAPAAPSDDAIPDDQYPDDNPSDVPLTSNNEDPDDDIRW